VVAAAADLPAPAVAHRRHAPAADDDADGHVPAVLRVETGDGTLAQVTLDGERKEAPGARFQHAGGKYVVVVADHEGNRQTCTVDLVEGRTRTLTVDMLSGACHLH
jgi:hypothetical protein